VARYGTAPSVDEWRFHNFRPLSLTNWESDVAAETNCAASYNAPLALMFGYPDVAVLLLQGHTVRSCKFTDRRVTSSIGPFRGVSPREFSASSPSPKSICYTRVPAVRVEAMRHYGKACVRTRLMLPWRRRRLLDQDSVVRREIEGFKKYLRFSGKYEVASGDLKGQYGHRPASYYALATAAFAVSHASVMLICF